jgi:hypothetical protein
MGILKILTIIGDIIGGGIVIVIGEMMLSFPLNMVWTGFNIYTWTIAPIMLWKAKNHNIGNRQRALKKQRKIHV